MLKPGTVIDNRAKLASMGWAIVKESPSGVADHLVALLYGSRVGCMPLLLPSIGVVAQYGGDRSTVRSTQPLLRSVSSIQR